MLSEEYKRFRDERVIVSSTCEMTPNPLEVLRREFIGRRKRGVTLLDRRSPKGLGTVHFTLKLDQNVTQHVHHSQGPRHSREGRLGVCWNMRRSCVPLSR